LLIFAAGDGVVRREARLALVFIGKPAVDPLIPLLQDPDDDVRWEAAKALLRFLASPAATPAFKSKGLERD
jgi:HEAT repeat protein